MLAPIGSHECHAVGRFRQACVALGIAGILLAAVLAISTGVRIDYQDFPAFAWAVAALLIASRLWWAQASHSRLADFFGTVGLVWLASISCGIVAMLGLRLHRPLTDELLLRTDHMLGLDTVVIVRWLVAQGQWIFSVMSIAYVYTVPALAVSLAAQALLGKRVEAWRAAFCFMGALLTVVIIAMLGPAKGMGLWMPEALLHRLPRDSMRYFWPHFDAFYSGRDPVLGLDSIDGVISFPSFHTVMGFITVAMWRKNMVMLAISLAWLGFMLLATFPYGGHYAVDILGGLAVWAAWFALSRRLETRSSTD